MKRIKHKLFMFGTEQTKVTNMYGFLFFLGELIQLIQLNFIAFKASYNNYPDNPILKFLNDASDTLIDHLNSPLVMNIIFCTFVFTMSLVYLIAIIRMPGFLTNVHIDYFSLLLVKISAIYAVLFKYIFIISTQFLLLKVFTCSGFDKCFAVDHTIWFIVAIFEQVFLLFLIFITMIINKENHPESPSLLASYDGLVDSLKLVLQIIAGTLFQFGLYWDILNQTSIAIGVCTLGIATMRWRDGGDHNDYINGASVFQELFTCFVHIGVFIQYWADSYESLFYISALLSLPATYLYVLLKQWTEKAILKTSLPFQQRSVNDVEIYIKKFCECLNRPESGANYMIMTSALLLHSQLCENVNCNCIGLSKFTIANKFINNSHEAFNTNATNSLSFFLNNYKSVNKVWTKFLILLVQESLAKFPKSPELFIQLSYIYLNRLNNSYMALYNVQNADSLKPSIFMEFQVFRQSREVEYVLWSSAQKMNSSSKSHTPNIEKNLYYVTLFNKFQDNAEDCINEHNQFWGVLLESEPDIGRLQFFGKKISERIASIHNTYEKIIEVNSNNLSFLYKYALFLKNVVHDSIETHSILNKIGNSSKIGVDIVRNWNCWEGHIGLIKASGDWKSLGQIKDVSSEVEKLLKYPKKELITMKCEDLMPYPIAKQHSKWVHRFYECTETKILNRGFPSFLKRKDGYFRLFEALVTLVPNLNDKILEFAIFVKETKNFIEIPKYLIQNTKPVAFLCDSNLVLIGINEIGQAYLHLPDDIKDFNKHEYNLRELLVDYVDIEVLLATREGKKFGLSASKLSMKISKDLLDSEMIDETRTELELQLDCFEYWGKITEINYGVDSTALKIYVCYLVPMSVEEPEKVCTSVLSETHCQEKNQIIKHYRDVSCSESGSAASSMTSDSRTIKELKLNLYERKFPQIVNRLRIYVLTFILIAITIESTILTKHSGVFYFREVRRKSISRELQLLIGLNHTILLPN